MPVENAGRPVMTPARLVCVILMSRLGLAHPEVFGETPTDLAARPEARAGLRRLVDELVSVFRATPYVHVGGDD